MCCITQELNLKQVHHFQMNPHRSTLERIAPHIKEYYDNIQNDFVPGVSRINLQNPTYSYDEVMEVMDSLLSSWVTMGKKVKQFETIFSKYMGVGSGTMVNSGSSANLVALSALSDPRVKNRISPKEEVITPALTWSTTVFPISLVKARPVFVDVCIDSFNIDENKIEDAITEKTKAIMPVHLLGNPCAMDVIMEIAETHDLFVIEDTCESYGAKYRGKKVGSYGDVSTASFFFSHHISTIEGGMVLSNNESLMNITKTLRGFGWIRDMANKTDIQEQYSTLDPKFLFISLGYNLRPTEIQGAFGIHQMKLLDRFISIRKKNATLLSEKLCKHSDYIMTMKENPKSDCIWFGYPIIVKEKAPFTSKMLRAHLETHNIETRAIMAGNIVRQPALKQMDYSVSGSLDNSNYLTDNAFFFGIHQGLGEAELEYISSIFDKFMAGI